MSTVSSLLEQEYMTLAPGVGIIPEKFRNRGYSKLDFAPGEGGLRPLADARQTASTDQMQALLAALAAGANPQEFAKNLLTDTNKPTSRGRRGSQEA
jgi:hypothetical protein